MFSNKKKSLGLVAIIAVSFITGVILQQFVFSSDKHNDVSENSTKVDNTEKANVVWTCSMHPSIRLPEKGRCPICNMELIPLSTENGDDSDVQISISSNALKRLEIETTPVVRKFVDSEIRMLGKVNYDETRLSYIAAWVPGRLEKLFINYTGIPVKQGEHMATIYSPDLITAQEELIQAVKFQGSIQNNSSDTTKKTAMATVKASREKLSLLGLSSEQINKIEKTGKSEKIVNIDSPIQGIVIDKNAKEGMYVKTGTRIYTVADLSSVWVELDAYESDLALIKYGNLVEFTTETYPGKKFEGKVEFIDPVVTPKSQTVKVRVSVPNENLELKPGMFVKAIVRSHVDSDGNAVKKVAQETWVCPMHPQIIDDKPGECSICHMDLVKKSTSNSSVLAPLIIPVTAAMKTGKRAIVYVEVPNKEKPTYEGREVILGSRVGNFYIVKEGLDEGDFVVTKGNFKLDAEMQIRAKPSMMSYDPSAKKNMTKHMNHQNITLPPDKMTSEKEIPQAFTMQLNKLLKSYFAIQKAMVDDNAKNVSLATRQAIVSLKAVDMTLLDNKTHMLWMKSADALSMTLQMLSKQSTLVKQRELLPAFTDEMLQVVQQFSVGQANIYKASCPMAFDNKGASWLQDTNTVLNPYFGDMMLHCGSIDEVIQENSNE